MLYRILLALHIISVISWMAGILYLIRLFVYHSAEEHEVVSARFKIMEYRLYRYITVPAMWASVLFGAWMIVLHPALLEMRWLQCKLLLVVALLASTLYCGRICKRFSADQETHSERFFRIFNEVPTLLMIAIVFLVILKPWL